MKKDIKIKDKNGHFKFRVCGVIKKNDKYLVSNYYKLGFYCFPGGHVQMGENTEEAVLRETVEETNIPVKISALLVNTELFVTNPANPLHEICYYYLMTPTCDISTEDICVDEVDNGKNKHHEYKWLTLDQMAKLDLRPNIMVDILKNNLQNQHVIIRQTN